MAETTRQRIDKWLWFARLVKTRAQAAKLVETGGVRINRMRVVKPGHDVKPGDVLTLTLYSGVRILRITGLAERRGPPAAGRALYEEPADTAKNPDASQKTSATGSGNC